MISGFAEDVIARGIREGVTLAPTADGLRIHYQAHVAPLSASLRARLLEHKPAILAVLSASSIKSFSWGFAPFEVDGVLVVYCATYDEAEALIREMIADAGGKPIAVDLETAPIPSERKRLAALTAERRTINSEAIAFRAAGKKTGAPQAELDAHTETADAKLEILDRQLAYAKSAGLDPRRAEVRLLQAFGGGARAMVVDVARAGQEVLGLLQGVDCVFHGAPFDLSFLQHRGVTLGKVHDSQQAAKLVLGESKCGLAQAVKHYLKVELPKDLQTSDWSAPDLTEDQITYAARDAIWLWRLCPPLFRDLGPQVSAYKIQTAVAPAIARLNTTGVAVDLNRHTDALRALAEQDAIACAGFRAACIAIGKPELASTVPETAAEIAAVLKALLTADELAQWKLTTKSRELSTARAELRRAAHHLPIAHLVERSEAQGPRRSFGETLRMLVSPVTGRVHPHYTIAGAQTGRSTSSKPNVQGAPRNPKIRAVFKAADGYVLAAADYNCMELRAAAYFFDDLQLADVFERGDDPHKLTASRVAGRPMDTITKEERNRAKNVNFGTIYGIGPASLVAQIWRNYQLVISLDDAENLLAGFVSLYPTMIEHRREYAEFCQSRRAIIIGPNWREGRGRIIPLGRLPADQSPTTCAYAFPIQGGCADIAMAALTAVDRRLLDDKLDARLVAWIHDELLVETRETNVDQVKAILQHEMERAFVATFPTATLRNLVEVKTAANWGAFKEEEKKEEAPCAP